MGKEYWREKYQFKRLVETKHAKSTWNLEGWSRFRKEKVNSRPKEKRGAHIIEGSSITSKLSVDVT